MPETGWKDFRFEGIGTSWEISTPRPLDPPLRRRLLGLVERFDADWSRFRADSRVAALARDPGQYGFPTEAGPLGRLYRSLFEISGGAMTPLIGTSLERLGYDAGYSLQPSGSPEPAPAWDDVLEWTGTTLTTTAPVVLDIGAAGKGLLVDLLAAELEAAAVDAFIVDAGGDLLARGRAPVPVALEHPYNPAQAIGVVQLADHALCASAANRRAWGDGLHHVLDGTTGRPVQTAVATWAMAETGMLADALATALFFVPGTALEHAFDFSWLVVFSDGSAAYSAGFEGTLFT
ncbi:FAD:protein FMN transferase [Pseudarthrobacter phenanthrenivorans]|uniref:FAD:protein FMN transferase n=1 Tax=Pseudarthrobacter phenanthrenivorans TaxID=361575 RepID=A0A3B0FVB2_PSEPS|nr:FAD:protein FMN transferase [Pseudarthrobacter phenanthrenivorans]RKO26793.1 FAD:protein FMN transferase [Pseudarthrobacter phenanthrenivorans]